MKQMLRIFWGGYPGLGDVLAWNHTKSGLFSVKSAYHLAVKRKRGSRGNIGSSNSCSEHKGWLALWATQVPGKIKVHVWRLVENGLAVGSELSHRKIKYGVFCLACGRIESLVHRFWFCPHSAQAWTLLSEKTGLLWEPPPKRLTCHAELRGWLLDWIGKSNGDQMSWFFYLLYNLWQARNDARESMVMRDPSVIVAQSLAGAFEWKEIHSKTLVIKSSVVEQWQRPEDGFLKVNVDGAFRHAESNGGGGAVVRNCHGEFCAGASHFFPHVTDVEGAELLACRLGLELAKECGVQKIILEMDNVGVKEGSRWDITFSVFLFFNLKFCVKIYAIKSKMYYTWDLDGIPLNSL